MNLKGFSVDKSELIRGLSYAIDLAEKKYSSHAQHIAFISIEIGKNLGYSDDDLDLLFYSSLLHDIGAGDTYGLLEHSKRGSEMIKKLPIDNKMSEIILYHHEFVDGSGPLGRFGNDIPIISQIIHLANQFDYKFTGTDYDNKTFLINVKQWLQINQRLFDEDVINGFRDIIDKGIVFTKFFEVEFCSILENAYKPKTYEYGLEDIKSFAEVFSIMIDNRSQFTHKHSVGLCEIVERMTQRLNYDILTQEKMQIAALLHDLGKLGIENEILDKPGRLTVEERDIVEKHAYNTFSILSNIKGFDDIAKWAGQHHEKLNGTGYPFKLTSEYLVEPSRLMAICDIFQALTEERPYRKSMDIYKAFDIIDNMVQSGELDEMLVVELKEEFSVAEFAIV